MPYYIMLLYILLSTIIISLIALVGVFTLSLKDEFLNKILFKLVALSSGALLGGAFLHLMPEGVKNLAPDKFFSLVLLTLIIYLLIEKILHWRHCHKKNHCKIHTVGYMNLLGDSIHNFIDGLIIAATFLINIPLGITTVFAIALHEIPQEIGDFGVLLYSGFKKRRALMLNFATALTVIAGGIAGFLLSIYIEKMTKFLLPIAAGGFIYIALSDMIPELRKETKFKSFLVNLAVLLLGIGLMYAVKMLGA